MRKLIFTLLAFVAINVCAQTPTPGVTLGLQWSDISQVADGYMLYSPSSSNKGYLVDMCGQLINEWTFDAGSNYSGFYLLEDGSVIKLNLDAGFGGNAAYGDACFERRAWDNTLMWSYCGTGRYSGIHSDLFMLPNGNFCALVQDPHTATEAVQKGIDPNTFGNRYDTESVVEFEPVGLDDANVVWEWHLWDHLVQDNNPSIVETYGIVADNPDRFDADIHGSSSHFNSLYYIEERDHIIMSSWHDDEIYIIDHSLSSTDAAGPAGNFLFRWGRPQNYDHPGDQKLFGQHNPKLVPDNYAVHGGKITVFNNGFNLTQGSAACVINAQWDDVSQTYLKAADGTWLPNDFDFFWGGDVFPGYVMQSGIMGGVDPQENGNLMITEATSGRVSEVTPNGDVVWIYQGNTGQSQGSNPNTSIYKIDKYKPSYAGLQNQNLTANGTVESDNILTINCVAALQPSDNNAGIINVSNLATFSCESEIEPEINIINYGDFDLVTMEIVYSINGGPTQTYSWSGSLANLESETVTLPLISFTPVANNTINVEIVSVNGGPDDIPTNNVLTANFSSSTFAPQGTFTLEVQTDSYGDEISFSVQGPSGAVFFFANNFPDNQLVTETFNLLVPFCYEFTAADSFGDGILNGGFVRVYDPSGVVIMEVTGNTWSSESKNIKVDPNIVSLPIPDAGFEFYINDLNVDFTDISVGDSTTYFWDFGNGTTSTEQNPGTINYQEGGTYEVCLTVSNPTGSDEFCETFTLVAPPVSAFTVVLVDGNTVQLNNTSQGDNNTYIWDFGNATFSNEENPEDVVYTESGYYTICLTVNNAVGTDQKCLEIEIIISSVDEFTKALSLNVFPNPVVNNELNLTFNLKHKEDLSFFIYNTAGKLLMQENKTFLNTGANNTQILLTDLSPGNYLLKVVAEDEFAYLKFVLN